MRELVGTRGRASPRSGPSPPSGRGFGPRKPSSPTPTMGTPGGTLPLPLNPKTAFPGPPHPLSRKLSGSPEGPRKKRTKIRPIPRKRTEALMCLPMPFSNFVARFPALPRGSPLLETKLYIPRLRRGLVARPRLSERLSRGGESKLTLVSAPAGFGKTTLLAEWLAAAPANERSTAWLSLDPKRQPGRILLALCDRRPADGGARGRRDRALAPAGSPSHRRSQIGRSRHAAQRAQRDVEPDRAGPRRLPRHRRA